MAVKIIRKSARELEIMRKAGSIVWMTLNELEQAARPGVSTADLDALAERIIRSHGATPSFKGYHGYPASICASINEEVVHGIPKQTRILRESDIISIDLGARLNGFHGDSAMTFAVGQVSAETQRLLENLLRLMEAYSASRTLLILHMDRAAKGPDNAAERPR